MSSEASVDLGPGEAPHGAWPPSPQRPNLGSRIETRTCNTNTGDGVLREVQSQKGGGFLERVCKTQTHPRIWT